MTAISGTATLNTVVTVVAASSGNGDTIAAMFNGVVIRPISNTAAVATNASGTVTISWLESGVLTGNSLTRSVVAKIIGANTSLTSPITISVASATWLTS